PRVETGDAGGQLLDRVLAGPALRFGVFEPRMEQGDLARRVGGPHGGDDLPDIGPGASRRRRKELIDQESNRWHLLRVAPADPRLGSSPRVGVEAGSTPR